MVHQRNRYPGRNARGASLLEMVIVLTIAGILGAIALPQLIASRRLVRSAAVIREMTTQMRLARQLALSKRKAYTFVYDDVAKDMKVIGPIDSGIVALSDASYPSNVATVTNPSGSSVQAVSAINQQGLYGADFIYGMPTLTPAVPNVALLDGVSLTPMVGGCGPTATNKLCITFQPDGSVINRVTGNPESKGMFVYNNQAAKETATAISVLGSSGRIKIWRYIPNGNIYSE